MQHVAEVDEAVDQIINEMVIQDAGRMPVSLNLDNVVDLDEKTKIRVQAEFDGLLKLLHFHKTPTPSCVSGTSMDDSTITWSWMNPIRLPASKSSV
jgi:hypothetical protein